MIKDKRQLASAITNFFNKPNVQKQIANFLKDNNVSEKKLSHIFGSVITYMVSTRREEISTNTLSKILKLSQTENRFNCGILVAEQLAKQLINNNKQADFDSVLNLFKQNFINQGFYMHACNKAIQDGILQNGLIANANNFEQERKVIKKYIPYEFDVRAYKLYVTSCYNLLYSYGTLSPEWLYNSVKNKQVMQMKSKEKAKKLILENAYSNSKFDASDNLKLKTAINNIVDFYFKQKGFNIIIVDKHVTDSRGRQIFNRYDEEEKIDITDFQENDVIKRVEFFSPISNADKKQNQTKEEVLGEAINYLVSKYSVHELSSIYNVSAKDLAIASLPCHSAFTQEQTLEM